jgi:hypothetical protein
MTREVRVTIPHVHKQSIQDILATFFSKGDEGVRERLEGILKRSDELTFVLTSKSVRDNAIQIEVL